MKYKHVKPTDLIIKHGLVVFATLVVGNGCFGKFDGIELQRRAVHAATRRTSRPFAPQEDVRDPVQESLLLRLRRFDSSSTAAENKNNQFASGQRQGLRRRSKRTRVKLFVCCVQVR